jgi:hypothetical protein
MNERIRKLAEQNGFIHEHMTDSERHDASKKFETITKLIVEECAKVLTQHGSYFSGEGEPYHYAASLIEEHFGIE